MEPFDDDAEPWKPGTPPPPDERRWRHPSEMASGATPGPAHPRSPIATPGSRRRESVLAVGAGLIGALGAGALLVVLVPGSNDEPALVMPSASVAAQIGTVVTVVASERDVPPTTVVTATSVPSPSTPDAPPTTLAAVVPDATADSDATTPAPDTTSSTQDGPPVVELADSPPAAVPQGTHSFPLLVQTGATAVPLSDGEFLLTTAQGAGAVSTTVEVAWGGTPRLLATVVARGNGFTVLQLDRQVNSLTGATLAGMTLATSAPSPGTWVTVLSPDRRRGVIVDSEGGLAVAGVGTGAADLEGVPVVDSSGHLVGLCSHTRGTTVLIPVTDAASVIDDRRQHAWMGIAATTAFDDDQAPSVLVSEVAAGGPAERAGVRPGDTITALGSESVATVVELSAALERLQPGDTVTVDLRRDGEMIQVELTVSARPFSL